MQTTQQTGSVRSTAEINDHGGHGDSPEVTDPTDRERKARRENPWLPFSTREREEAQRSRLDYINWLCTERDPGFAPVAPRFRKELCTLLSMFESGWHSVLMVRMRIRNTEARDAQDEAELSRYNEVLSTVEVCIKDLLAVLRFKAMLDMNDIAGTDLLPFVSQSTKKPVLP